MKKLDFPSASNKKRVFLCFCLPFQNKRLSLHQNFASMKKELGKVLIDIAKLVVGGVILAGLMRQDIPPVFCLQSVALQAL